MINYSPLFKTMKEKNITSYALIYKHGINARTFHNIKINKGISTYTLERLCQILDCTPNDVIAFVEDK